MLANEVGVRASCLSLRVPPATTESFFEEYRFAIGTGDGPGGSNEELAPLYSMGYTHVTYGLLFLPGFEGPISSLMFINIPPRTDSNANEVDDFYEVGLAVTPVSTEGYIRDLGFGEEPIIVTWSREADSIFGICTIDIVELGLTFTHTFELYEYAGSYGYTVESHRLRGNFELQRIGNPAQTFIGRSEFIINNTDTVTLLSGVWTNETEAAFEHFEIEFHRHISDRYVGEFVLQDGDLATVAEDYDIWIVSMIDPRDGDFDNIPDFSDPPRITVVAPALSLRPVGNALELTVVGRVGNTVTVQHTDSLSAPNWTTFTNLTLTLSTQALTVPKSAGGQRFWRAQVP